MTDKGMPMPACLPMPQGGSGGISVLECFHSIVRIAVTQISVSGLFLGLFLGRVNVRSARRDVRFKVKEEYNSYRVSRAKWTAVPQKEAS